MVNSCEPWSQIVVSWFILVTSPSEFDGQVLWLLASPEPRILKPPNHAPGTSSQGTGWVTWNMFHTDWSWFSQRFDGKSVIFQAKNYSLSWIWRHTYTIPCLVATYFLWFSKCSRWTERPRCGDVCVSGQGKWLQDRILNRHRSRWLLWGSVRCSHVPISMIMIWCSWL